MKLSALMILEIKEDGIRQYPEEACGVIADGKYIPIKNIHPDPFNNFRLDPIEYAMAGKVDAVIHSHPDGNSYPSKRDMEQQQLFDVPWGIYSCSIDNTSEVVWLDPEGDPPALIGRSFIPGINDCYSLIRDWYRLERGVVLKDFPRDNDWWINGGDLYNEHYADANFGRLPDNEPLEIGDVFAMSIKSKVPNHGGVYIGNGYVLHHLNGQLSRRQQLGRWINKIDWWIRQK